MPLPSSGPLSAADLNTELGNNFNDTIDFLNAAEDFAVSFTTDGTNPIDMYEFYGLSAGYNYGFSDWNGTVSITEFGIISATAGNAAAVEVLSSNFTPLRTSGQTQIVDIRVTAPTTFNGQSVDNAGGQLTGTGSAFQPQVGRYLQISSDGGYISPLAGDDTSVALTVTDTYYYDNSSPTIWEIDIETLSANSIPVVSPLPISGTGTETVNASIANNPNGSLRDIRFRVTGDATQAAGGKTEFIDISQDTYTPVYPPTISIDSVSPSSPYSYSGAPQIVVTVSKTQVSSFTAQISPGIDGNSAIFSSIQPGGVTILDDTHISSTSNTFYIEIPARSDTNETTKESFLSVYISNGAGSDSDSYTLSQEGYAAPVYSWGGSLSINRNTGVVSVSGDDSAGTITLTPSSFDVVTSSTPRSVVVGNIVIPSGYQNEGTSFSETISLTQLAAQELISISADTAVSGQGESIEVTVDTTDVYNTQWTAYITYVDQDNSTNWVQLAAGDTGTGDGSFFVFVSANYVGSNGYNGTTRYFDIRVDKNGGGLSSNTLSFYQNVGSAPVQKPTFSVSPTSLDWTYSQSGIGNYQTITATWDGGSIPTSVSFYLSGIHYGLVQTDSNVPLVVSGGPWVAEATNDGAGTFQVGVYPLSTNSGTSDKTENLTINMGNSGGTTSTNIPLTQTYPVNWSTNVSSLSFTSAGGTQNITLDSSFSWTATVSGTGFSINTTSGGSGTNTISVTKTQSDLGGSGTVTFSASGQSDIVVSLSQAEATLEYNWFFGGVQQYSTSISVLPSSIATGYSIGLYAFRGSTADATPWQLSRNSGTFITVSTTTSGGGAIASTTTGQNTSGTPYLYINVAENTTSSTRTGSVDVLGLDGAYIATITISQSGTSGGTGGEREEPQV